MNPEIAFQFFKKFKSDHFSLAYMGEFDDELTEGLMRSNETSIQEPKNFKKRLSFLIAECFQNIIRHEDKPEIITRTNNKPKIFLLRNVGNSHYISATNLVSNTKKQDLELKLNSINTLSAEALREAYVDALTNNQISEKGGGGLGLIEIARRSGSPLEFAFEFVNYYLSVFYIQVRFIAPQNEENTIEDAADAITINETKEIYNLMVQENIFLIRKGDFSQESILPIINLIEGNLKLQTSFTGSNKTTMYLMVELLQNISKHGLKTKGEREGIFMISKSNNKYVLSAGNYIETNTVERLKMQLESVTQLDKNELIGLYKQTLFKNEPSEKGNAGIGLIEICKYSSEKINFSFNKIDETVSFFSLNVTI